jgi:hypothetical protein
MSKVYYHDNLETDQRLPHIGEPVAAGDLEAVGVFFKQIPEMVGVDEIAKERGYKNRDEVLYINLPVVSYHFRCLKIRDMRADRNRSPSPQRNSGTSTQV